MIADVELMLLPYSGGKQQTVLHFLIAELGSGKWQRFSAAVAFAKQSGNYVDLLKSLAKFAEAGNEVEMTFGADSFGAEARGSEYVAIATLLEKLGKQPTVRLFLYSEGSRTFHPKIYLFANEKARAAIVLVGSSNWSAGGFHDNVEANVLIRLDLSKKAHVDTYKQLRECFTAYWQEV